MHKLSVTSGVLLGFVLKKDTKKEDKLDEISLEELIEKEVGIDQQ